MNRKKNTALLSIGSNTILISMKLVAGIMTGSVSIISEAIHSTMDLLAAVIAFFSVRVSDRPPDEEHPYGHEKIENISGVIEGLLILGAAGWIIFEAVKKLLLNERIESVGLGFVVMFISALVNWLVSRRLYKVAKEEESIALEADALHLKADVYTSLGVGIGLLLIWVTGFTFLDPVVAIFVAVFILREAFELMKNAFDPLLDTKLSDMEIKAIETAIGRHSAVYFDFHDLRTRKSGKTKHIDLHLTVPKNMTVKKAHEICDGIEAEIEKELRNTKVLIHTEPCPDDCKECDKERRLNGLC